MNYYVLEIADFCNICTPDPFEDIWIELLLNIGFKYCFNNVLIETSIHWNDSIKQLSNVSLDKYAVNSSEDKSAIYWFKKFKFDILPFHKRNQVNSERCAYKLDNRSICNEQKILIEKWIDHRCILRRDSISSTHPSE